MKLKIMRKKRCYNNINNLIGKLLAVTFWKAGSLGRQEKEKDIENSIFSFGNYFKKLK